MFFINTLYVSMKILFLCYFKTEHLGNNSIVIVIIDHIHAIGWRLSCFQSFEFIIFTKHIKNLQLDTFAIIVLVDRTKEQINKTDCPWKIEHQHQHTNKTIENFSPRVKFLNIEFIGNDCSVTCCFCL